MEEILREYGSVTMYWWWLLIPVLLLGIGVWLGLRLKKNRDEWLPIKKDVHLYTSWGSIGIGLLLFGYVFLSVDIGEDFYVQQGLDNWTDEQGYYIESMGEIEERSGDTIKVEEDGKMVEKEVDTVLEGCNEDVYVEKTNGDVWICVK